MCRHNEQSQTYPASLISTIKANFPCNNTPPPLLLLLQLLAPVCKSPHLSPKIKTSGKERQASGTRAPEEQLFSCIFFFFYTSVWVEEGGFSESMPRYLKQKTRRGVDADAEEYRQSAEVALIRRQYSRPASPLEC